jgi:hypothetical protein
MLSAQDTAAAFYGQHMPDGLPREQRNAIRDALAALIAAERAAVREACAARAELHSNDGRYEKALIIAADLRALPLE